MRKALLSLAVRSQQDRIMEYARAELTLKTKAKYLGLWFEAIGCKRTVQVAQEALLVNKLKRVFITWRCLKEKASLSGIFSANVTRRRLLPAAFAALYHNARRQSHMRYC